MSSSMDVKWAKEFSEEWVSAWNSHDLERILSHYADDFEMTSPLIVDLMKEPSGVLRGKEKIRSYWKLGLSLLPPLRFELLDVFVGVDSIALHYRRTNGKLAVETLQFNRERKVIKGNAHY